MSKKTPFAFNFNLLSINLQGGLIYNIDCSIVNSMSRVILEHVSLDKLIKEISVSSQGKDYHKVLWISLQRLQIPQLANSFSLLIMHKNHKRQLYILFLDDFQKAKQTEVMLTSRH